MVGGYLGTGVLGDPLVVPSDILHGEGVSVARTEAVLRGVWVRQCFGELLWLSTEVSPKPED